MIHRIQFLLMCGMVLSGPLFGQWEKVNMTDMNGHTFYASSELDKPADLSTGKYAVVNLFDNDPATAWVEGVPGKGTGQYLITGPYTGVPDEINIQNGYQKSEALFYQNNRLRSAVLTLMVGITIPGHVTEFGPEVYLLPVPGNRLISFADTMTTTLIKPNWSTDSCMQFEQQAIEAFKDTFGISSGSDNPGVRYFIRLEIKCIYPGSKWDDTCISGLMVKTGKPSRAGLAPGEKITEILEADDGRKIVVNTNFRKHIVLADAAKIETDEGIDEAQHGFLVLTLMDTTPDKEWAQIDLIYGHPGAGRTEEVARLYNVRLLQQVPPSLLGEDIYSMYGFDERNGKNYLVTDAGNLDLDEVYRKLLAAKKEK
jgi:hypothetical protein